MSPMKVAAIVGMTGSGKSEVARLFEESGFSRIRFGDITDEEIKDFVTIFQKTLRSLEKIYISHNISKVPFSYNFYIYPKENWYLRIIPRFVYRAGFELGTGLSVNIVDPIEAAKQFREMEDKMGKILHKLKKLT